MIRTACTCNFLVSTFLSLFLISITTSRAILDTASLSCSTKKQVKKNNEDDTEWGQAIQEPPVAVQSSVKDSHILCQARTVDESVEIAIIGGGLIGLAVAIGLVERKLVDVKRIKVYERAPQLRSSSQGILALQPNCMSALDSIHPGIAGKVQETGCERHYFRKTTIDAEGVTSDKKTNTGDEFLSKYGRRKVGISWHNMQRILTSMLPKENDMIQTGRTLCNRIKKRRIQFSFTLRMVPLCGRRWYWHAMDYFQWLGVKQARQR
jgi:hypothetical protein